jgi:hypothetical protein
MEPKKLKLRDTPRVTEVRYSVHQPWGSFFAEDGWLSEKHQMTTVEIQPEFQRGYVWTEDQQISYVENMCKGFITGRDIYFNHPYWMGSMSDDAHYSDFPIVCVDGQQRIGAARRFINNELPIFGGHFFHDFEDWERMTFDLHQLWFNLCVNNLKTDRDVYHWYLELNSGGTIHTEADVARVPKLLEGKE